jgi:7,8-dihydropterin-6-yl-methyl-4-(beta-D-ribofuranosyl)aminobenzene 5'-phosphate synthase
MDNHTPSHINIAVLYDNRSLRGDLQEDWGFACLIRGFSKTILFDTGASGKILINNMSRLGLSPQTVDAVVISHDHKDHTGGLAALLEKNPSVEVWLPDFFPLRFKDSLRIKGAKLFEVNESQELCAGIYTTGVISGWIKEQSLVIESPKGIVLVTGCAHPRIVNILESVRSRFDSPIYLVMGGFHLGGFEKPEIKSILEYFKQAGVQKVGPAHCSGELAHSLFRTAYGNDYLKMGVGMEIAIP